MMDHITVAVLRVLLFASSPSASALPSFGGLSPSASVSLPTDRCRPPSRRFCDSVAISTMCSHITKPSLCNKDRAAFVASSAPPMRISSARSVRYASLASARTRVLLTFSRVRHLGLCLNV